VGRGWGWGSGRGRGWGWESSRGRGRGWGWGSNRDGVRGKVGEEARAAACAGSEHSAGWRADIERKGGGRISGLGVE